MQFVINTRGEVSPRASVTFTGISSATLRIQVREPKLALKVTGPPRVVAGDPVNFMLTVSNTGDCLAGQVKVRARLPVGLQHPHGKDVDFDIGDLATGEAPLSRWPVSPRVAATSAARWWPSRPAACGSRGGGRWRRGAQP